ncbi:hypothetical protein [Virgibacillus chiguensis]|uniref:Uncharacterized protein n=1 Tax=Virgibacillus chiguensis TaxID=411959 RepID=A0A1M5QJP3_9BACI|nr:hypothetical protein [Virgibacillus chiguensis]SHH13783.1 hypothetical protein SAMN05421807_104150 [Virgibacillus chiguensis]
MNMALIIFLFCLFLVALGGTLYVFKQEERKMKQYEAEGETAQSELQRSMEYETKSLKSNVPILIWIYAVTILIGLIAFFVYAF